MPRPKSSESKSRLNLELPERVRTRIEQIRVLAEADSMSEVIRRAISVYATLLRVTQDGDRLVLRSANGEERELVLL